MVRRLGMVAGIILMMAIALPLIGQDTEAAKAEAAKAKDVWSFYKLEVTVRELDGTKTVNSRSYDFSQRVGDWGQLRVGSRVPVTTAVLDSAGSQPKTQFQYVNIGLNLDSRVQERANDIAFDWRLDLSSVAPEQTQNPVIRSVASNGQTILAIGKPTMMTSVDDLNSTHKFVFEVTATKIK